MRVVAVTLAGGFPILHAGSGFAALPKAIRAKMVMTSFRSIPPGKLSASNISHSMREVLATRQPDQFQFDTALEPALAQINEAAKAAGVALVTEEDYQRFVEGHLHKVLATIDESRAKDVERSAAASAEVLSEGALKPLDDTDAPALASNRPNPSGLVPATLEADRVSNDGLQLKGKIASTLRLSGAVSGLRSIVDQAVETYRHARVTYFNRGADLQRSLMGVGPERKMSLTLARQMVDKGDWSLIALYSGMQNPLADAINYLQVSKDRHSIPLLMRLFVRYSPNLHLGQVQYDYGIFTETVIWGPGNYMPPYLQGETAKALLSLMTPDEARKWIDDVFQAVSKAGTRALGQEATAALTEYIVKNKIVDQASTMLSLARQAKWRFDRDLADYNSGNARSMEYSNLYKSQDLANAAFLADREGADGSMALDILVNDFNSSRDHIGYIVLNLTERILQGEARATLIRRLDPARYQDALKRFDYIFKKPKPPVDITPS